MDAGDQVGYLAGMRAVELAMDKARAHGIAVVGARNTWYTGMFSYYLEKAADAIVRYVFRLRNVTPGAHVATVATTGAIG